MTITSLILVSVGIIGATIGIIYWLDNRKLDAVADKVEDIITKYPPPPPPEPVNVAVRAVISVQVGHNVSAYTEVRSDIIDLKYIDTDIEAMLDAMTRSLAVRIWEDQGADVILFETRARGGKTNVP